MLYIQTSHISSNEQNPLEHADQRYHLKILKAILSSQIEDQGIEIFSSFDIARLLGFQILDMPYNERNTLTNISTRPYNLRAKGNLFIYVEVRFMYSSFHFIIICSIIIFVHPDKPSRQISLDFTGLAT